MDKDEIRQAVELLTDSDNYAELKRELNRLIADKEIPKRFAGRFTPLNEMIAVHNQDEELFHRLIALVEKSRKKDPETSRTDYQKHHMKQRRARLITAVLIEELRRGKKMTPTEKEKFRDTAQARWMARRDTFLETKGNITWTQKNEFVSAFWRIIDEELEIDLIKVKQARAGR